jgi:hypothetical protein
VDDKYGVDIDEVYEMEELLPILIKNKYAIEIRPALPDADEDTLHIGYLKLSSLQ